MTMAIGARSAHALFWGVSAVALCLCDVSTTEALAQQPGVAQAAQDAGKRRASRSGKRAPQVAQSQDPQALNANAQAGTRTGQTLDTITITASKTEERAIDALAPVSVV